MDSKPTVICLTPIKNEAWILDRFLQCASLWADLIIVADQNSEDGSREIARRYPKVILIENSASNFNEPERQKLLLEAARKIPGPRLLVALDADEMLTANFMYSPEWTTVLRSPPGTVIEFEWANLNPDFSSYWAMNNFYLPLGFMDDESDHIGTKIHSPRLPLPLDAIRIRLRNIRVLHYQYVNLERMKSKHRWYQCWEKLNQSWRKSIEIYRIYHHMDTISKQECQSLPKEWLFNYEEQGIDMTSVQREPFFWWDRDILLWFEKHGTENFRKQAIWDVDWSDLSQKCFPDGDNRIYKDPRNWLDKLIHTWLKKTQHIRSKLWVKAIDKLLTFLKW